MRHKDARALEKEMIFKAKKDPLAFGALYERYFERLFLFLFKRVGDMDVAGDLAQETMLKAMHNLDKYEDRGFQFSSWLFRIGSNEVNQYFRKQKRKQTVSVDESNILNLLSEATIVKHSDDLINKVLQVISNLPPEKSEIIELRFFAGFSFQEIAEFYNVSEATAKMRLYRLLDRIKQSL